MEVRYNVICDFCHRELAPPQTVDKNDPMTLKLYMSRGKWEIVDGDKVKCKRCLKEDEQED